MKKILLLIVFISFTATSFSQQIEPAKPITKQDYLDKSKRQKSGAWVLLGAGAGLIGVGLLIGNREESSFDDAATGGIIGGIGAVSAIISIPLFIASDRNKRKAAEATSYFELRRDHFIVPVTGQGSYPALAFHLRF